MTACLFFYARIKNVTDTVTFYPENNTDPLDND